MAIGSRIDANVATGWTFASFYPTLKTALSNAGFTTLIDEYSSGGNNYLVFGFTVDSSKTYGGFYVRLAWNANLTFSQYIGNTWNTSTKAGTNESQVGNSNGFVTTSPVNLIAVKEGTELSCLMVSQSGNDYAIAALIPANRPSWWDLNVSNYGFISNGNSFANWRPPNNNAWGNNRDFQCNLGNGNLQNANRVSTKRDIGYGILLFVPDSEGYGGRTNDEIVMIAANNLSRYNLVRVDAATPRDYVILGSGAGALGVRLS